jgi:hypothetical protein
MELFRRYIPAESPTDFVRRRNSTEFETKLFPSGIFTDGKFPSVIPLVLSDFLAVFDFFFPVAICGGIPFPGAKL